MHIPRTGPHCIRSAVGANWTELTCIVYVMRHDPWMLCSDLAGPQLFQQKCWEVIMMGNIHRIVSYLKTKYKDLTLRWCCCAVGSCSPPARPPFPSSTTWTNSRHSIFHFPACVLANLHFILLSVFSPSFIGFSLLSFFLNYLLHSITI